MTAITYFIGLLLSVNNRIPGLPVLRQVEPDPLLVLGDAEAGDQVHELE